MHGSPAALVWLWPPPASASLGSQDRGAGEAGSSCSPRGDPTADEAVRQLLQYITLRRVRAGRAGGASPRGWWKASKCRE